MKIPNVISLPRLALFAAALVAVLPCFAFTDNKWQADPSGNWNGKWSDVAHWSKGRLPNGSADDNAIFDNQAVPYTVEIDGDYVVPGFFKIGGSGARPGAGKISFVGTGSVRQAQSTMYVYSNREVSFGGSVTIGEHSILEIMEGADVYMADSASIRVSSNMKIEAGAKFNVADSASALVSNYIWFYDAAELHVRNSGCVQGKLYLDGSCTSGALTMSGGSLKCPATVPAFPAAFDISVTGGRLIIVGNCNDCRFLPKGEMAVFEHLGSGGASFSCANSFVGELSGLYIGTNSAANSGFRLDYEAEIFGGGRLYADWYVPFSPSTVTSVVDVTHLGIGTRCHLDSNGAVSYPSDMTISAFGDYISPNLSCVSLFSGQVVFDTLDALGRSTAHTATFPGVSETPGFGFRVQGGGSQSLSFGSIDERIPAIRNIDVAAGTTLLFTNTLNKSRYVRPDFLSLGANAVLGYKPASGYTIDAAETEIAASAAVNVNMASLSATQDTLVQPVFMAASGNAPALSLFSFVNSSNWEMKKVDGIIYAKSTTAETSPNPSPYRWTGANSGNWSDGGNWNGGSIPGGENDAFFTLTGSGRNEITIPAGGVSVRRIIGGGRNDDAGKWYRSAEPFLFQGGDLTINNTGSGDYKSSIFTCSKSPIVFDCKVVGTTLGVLGYSYVAFRGGMTATELKPVGEVRIGGNASVSKVTVAADSYSDSRYTTLTVLNGGNLTTSQSSTNNKHLGLRVLGGGSAAFAETFAYSSTTVSTSWQVDGRLAFSGILNLNAPVTLSGTGRVDVAANNSNSGDGRITMKGGVILSPITWHTVCHATSNNGMMPLSVPDAQTATFAPRGNIEYGPAADNSPTTTSAGRALRLGRRATLTVATDDIDNPAVTRDVTFVDPIEAETMAKIVKTGSGKLTLASSANSFTGTSGLDVRCGTLAWTAAQSLGSLKVSPGTTLEILPSHQGDSVLTVRSNVNLEGVRISFAKGSAVSATSYQTAISVPSGATITGTPIASGNVKMRLCEIDGCVSLQVCKARGFIVDFK